MTDNGRRVSMEDWLAARTQARSLPTGRTDRLGGLLPGLYRSFFKGRGLEYDESRRHQPGDDHRHIDWRVSARAGQLYTKAFREERERAVLFALDLSASMRFGTRRCFKWVRGAELMALLAWLAVDNGDRAGGLVYGLADGLEERAPGIGEPAAMRLFKLLDDAQGRTAAKESDLSAAIRRLRRHAVHGTLIVILSDFREVTTEDRYGLADLARDKDVCLVPIFDPLEQRLPEGESLAFWTAEGVRTLAADDRPARENHAREFAERCYRVETLCREIGARHMTLKTEDEALPALLDWSRLGGAEKRNSLR